MSKICDNIQTRFVQFTARKKLLKKSLRIETDPS